MAERPVFLAEHGAGRVVEVGRIAFADDRTGTTVEVAVLALLLIIFGCIELCLLKEYLSYTQ